MGPIPAVAEVAVFGLPHERLGEELVTVVAPKPGSEILAADLQRVVKTCVCWLDEMMHPSCVWRKIVVFSAQPDFDGMAAECHLLLAQRQRLTLGNKQLPFDQIKPGQRLGDRMLDLQPGVHLHQKEWSPHAIHFAFGYV